MKNSKFKTQLRLLIGIFNCSFLILHCSATSVFFPVAEMSGSTNDVTINVKAVNNPVIWNGRFYYQPKLGTNIVTVGGYATNSFIPGIYTVTIAGLNKSWTMSVTNAASELSAVDLSKAITIYSGLISIAGVNLQVVNDGLGNITITDTNSGGVTSFNLFTHTNLSYLGLSASARNQIETNAAWQAFLATNGWTGGGTNGSASGPQTNVANYVTPDTDRAIIRVNASGQAPLLSYGVASDTLVFNRPPVGDGSGLTNLPSTGSSTNLIGGNTNQSVTVSNITSVGAGPIAVHGPVTFDDTISAPEANYASANLSNVTFAGLSNGVAVLQSDGTLDVSTNLASNITGNAAGATNWFGSEQYVGVWDNYRVGHGASGVGNQAIVTIGSLFNQTRISANLVDATCELGTPSVYFWGGKWFFNHLTAGYTSANYETNTWGIMRSDDNGNSWVRHAFINASNVSPALPAGQVVTSVWDGQPFVDNTNGLHVFINCGTNKNPAQVSSGMLTYETHPLDNSLLTWSDPQLCTGLPVAGFDCSVVASNSTDYLMFKREATDSLYINCYQSTNLMNWTVIRSGNWAGWGNSVEALDMHYVAGLWVAIMATNGSYGGTVISTSTDFTNWTALKRYSQSGNYGNGGVWPAPKRFTPRETTQFFPYFSNSTFSVGWVLGEVSNTPPANQTFLIKGGTSGVLALDSADTGGVATMLSYDPLARNLDFYIAGRYGVSGTTLLKVPGGTQNAYFYGVVGGNFAGATNLPVSALAVTNLQTSPFTNGVAGRIPLTIGGTTYYLTVSTNVP